MAGMGACGTTSDAVAPAPSVLVSARLRPPARVWVTGDWHAHHAQHASALFEAHYARAVAERWYLVHVGDALEMVTPSSRVAHKGALADQTASPEEQRQWLIDRLRRIHHGIVGPGNHETRIDFAVGINFIKSITDAEGMRVRAVEWPGFIELRVGRVTYYIYVHHGEGPTVNPFTLHDRLLMNTEAADVIVAGHIHQSANDVVVIESPHGPREVIRLRAGHYLDRPRYQMIRPLGRIGAPGSWLLTLDGDAKQIRVERLSR